MKILVDADACPKVVKEIVFRAAQRLKIMTTLFANHTLPIPRSAYISFIQVPGGFDVVDERIVQIVEKNDLVITADIPLAAAVIAKAAYALNPRGEFYTQENIQHRLALRNYSEERRSLGQVTRGPAPLNLKDQQAFANALDRFLTKIGNS